MWLGSLVFFPGVAASRAAGGKDPFPEAIDYYLQGNWFQAERVLSLRLRQNAGDLDARLMLATLLRRTGRNEEAEKQVDLLERCDEAWKWGPEIYRERRLLAEAKTTGDTELGAQAPEPAEPTTTTQSNVSAAA
jgi:thioredoxin-like negative regulator of GroEL